MSNDRTKKIIFFLKKSQAKKRDFQKKNLYIKKRPKLNKKILKQIQDNYG